MGRRYPGYGLVLNGAPEESEASEFAAMGWREVNPGGAVVNLCGRLTPRESAAAFGRAKLFVGHDSGPMHLAAAVADALRGDLCSAEQAAGLVSLWEPAPGGVSQGALLGVRAGDLHRGEEEVPDFDHGGRGDG